ncbi:hypothetical protein NAEGRDRAFT_80948 [Naegleria gruberi]|uniref:Uncharacterized protein n=1 Tax=Naegleria gruberi TaxID=5762 RepID=D2VR79_NAEGR|nr:uncharacterized protein NAEGRDRAFT_80948 [Naegleria gruberi]EFC40558.1 hypothetical protein NAEGRDRAFT_80948 [Naegleria gruberi]|eukprot:XP_002673302.1 hypothetical protein NAEGRDRAFT_80948 [Naegleria gruberi strain NEG-M]
MAHEIFANTIVLSEGNSFLSSSSEGLYNVLMQSVQAYNGGGFPGLPFFNDTMCGDYAVLSASLPDNMDLCAWRAWLFFVLLIFILTIVSGIILTILSWVVFAVINFCKCLFGGDSKRKNYQRIGEEPLSRHFQNRGDSLFDGVSSDGLVTRTCGLSYCCIVLFLLVVCLAGVGFSVAFYVGLDRAADPLITSLEKARNAINETATIMSNTTYQSNLTGFVEYIPRIQTLVQGAIQNGQAYLENAVIDNNDRLHLEYLIYDQLNGATKSLYENSTEINALVQKYQNIVSKSSIDVFNLDDVFNYQALMPNGLVARMLIAHENLVDALSNTSYLVEHLNYTNEVFSGNTYSKWNQMYSEVFVPLAINAPTIPDQMGQFQTVLDYLLTYSDGNTVFIDFQITYMSVFIGFFAIGICVALFAGIGLTRRSNALLNITCCCSCSLLVWFVLFAAVNIAVSLAIAPYCVHKGDLFDPNNLKHSEPVKVQPSSLGLSDINSNTPNIFVNNYTFVINVTRFFMNCGGKNFDQEADAQENVLDAIQLAQQGHYATVEDYNQFFDAFISGMESLNFTEQAMNVANNGQTLFKNMLLIQQDLAAVGNTLQSYVTALEALKSRVNNNTLYEDYEANKQVITQFQNEMTPLLNKLIQEAQTTNDIQYNDAQSYFTGTSYPEFLQGYQLGSTFMINYISNLPVDANVLVPSAETVGLLLNDLKDRTTCSFMSKAIEEVNTDLCGVMGIGTLGNAISQILVSLFLFLLIPIGVILASRLHRDKYVGIN